MRYKELGSMYETAAPKLDAISPIDGRYRRKVEELSPLFSERAVMRHRLIVEGEYLIALSEHPDIGTRAFSGEEKATIRGLYDLDIEDAVLIKAIEVRDHEIASINKGLKTKHDVKSIEYFIKHILKDSSLADSLEWTHFALTSEDVTNLAYAMMLSKGIGDVIIPTAKLVQGSIDNLAEKYSNTPLLARTHGQPASPTTFGKEMNVYSSRLRRQIDRLGMLGVDAKLNGATGCYDAHVAAYPDVDWIGFSRDFIAHLSEDLPLPLVPNFVTTQIEPHDSYAEIFDAVKRLNTVLIDFDVDMWLYIMQDLVVQKPVEGEVGSSTMPHKVNPIDFENSEFNLEKANSDLELFSRLLPKSRLQRQLSDSTLIRNFGVALGHSVIGYKSTLAGIGKIDLNEDKVRAELDSHPEILAEAYQTVLRREGLPMPYEQLKELTRGRRPSLDDMIAFVDGLDISDELKAELKAFTPQNYIGIAEKLAKL